jgi:hypothetical protein
MEDERMRTSLRLPLYCALLSAPVWVDASVVQRCQDSAGNISFTSLGCPADQASHSLDVHAPLPGSVAPSSPEPREKQQSVQPREPVIVGQRDDGCGNILTADQRRQATINQRVMPGMTIREVENMLGRPAKTTQRNGELRYQYEDKKKSLSHTVTFDADGCVKGKR